MGADDRGSRPIGNAPDDLFQVVTGARYGWPDYIAADKITSLAFRAETGPPAKFLTANHSALPPPQAALFRFATHAAATKFTSHGAPTLCGPVRRRTSEDRPRGTSRRGQTRHWRTLADQLSLDGRLNNPLQRRSSRHGDRDRRRGPDGFGPTGRAHAAGHRPGARSARFARTWPGRSRPGHTGGRGRRTRPERGRAKHPVCRMAVDLGTGTWSTAARATASAFRLPLGVREAAGEVSRVSRPAAGLVKDQERFARQGDRHS